MLKLIIDSKYEFNRIRVSNKTMNFKKGQFERPLFSHAHLTS